MCLPSRASTTAFAGVDDLGVVLGARAFCAGGGGGLACVVGLGLFVVRGGSGRGAHVVRRSGGRGRATCIRLGAGIALFRQGKCLGSLLRRQCAVDAVKEVLVCCRHARPPHIAVAAGDIRIRSTGQGRSPTRYTSSRGSSSHSFEGGAGSHERAASRFAFALRLKALCRKQSYSGNPTGGRAEFVQNLHIFLRLPQKMQNDPLLLNKLYTNPKEAFLYQPKSLTEIKDSCLVFLDTNVLLLPYNTGKESLESIGGVYEKLIKQARLRLPARVMQEFESNVPDQLKRIFLTLSQSQNVNINPNQLPLLEKTKEYVTLKKLEVDLKLQISEYRKAIQNTLSAIEEWNHDDPVRQMYRAIFKDVQSLQITSFDETATLEQWKYRLGNKIPPGYKDGGKDDSGIGDYIVWQALLDECSAKKSDAILVTGETKPDWWHISNERPLYPRRELVEEFRKVTGGQTIQLVPPAKFFQLFGASPKVVEEIKTEQSLARHRPAKSRLRISDRTMEAIRKWAESRFGARIHSWYKNPSYGRLTLGRYADGEDPCSIFVVPFEKLVSIADVSDPFHTSSHPSGAMKRFAIVVIQQDAPPDYITAMDWAVQNSLDGHAIGYIDWSSEDFIAIEDQLGSTS